MRHPNIVKFLGASWNRPPNVCMLLELLNGGELSSFIHGNFQMSSTYVSESLQVSHLTHYPFQRCVCQQAKRGVPGVSPGRPVPSRPFSRTITDQMENFPRR